MYKLVAIDIDGTLINDRMEITKEVNEAIQAARAKGVKIVLCTGRPINGVHRYIEELRLNEGDEFVITFNGALVQKVKTSEEISGLSLNYQNLKELYDLAKKIHSPMHFYDSENIYTPNKAINKYTVLDSHVTQVPLHYRILEEIPEDIQIPKIMFIDEPERLNKVIAAIPESFKEKYEIVQSSPFFLEILHPGVTKGNAIKQLAEKLSIQREKIVCIGDGKNDLSMVEYAGCGVAMANAVPSIKEIAKFHTMSNNGNGVAYAIEKLILEK